jgi:hypothetical protein
MSTRGCSASQRPARFGSLATHGLQGRSSCLCLDLFVGLDCYLLSTGSNCSIYIDYCIFETAISTMFVSASTENNLLLPN